MSTAVFNRKAIQAGAGHLFLLPTPASVVATTADEIVKELLENFVMDADIRGTLKAGVKPWLVQGKDGFSAKVDQKALKDEDNLNPEYVLGYIDIGYEATVTMKDLDAAHLADVLSAKGGQIINTPASATQAGRTTILGGGQRMANVYMALFRYESSAFPGEFRYVFIPACTLNFDGDSNYVKDKAIERKVKLVAQPSGLLIDPETFRDVIWFEDYVTAAKTA